MNLLITILQDININEKLKEAPDSSYGIGVFIGTLLPFVSFGYYSFCHL